MQLSKSTNVATALASATLALLGQTQVNAEEVLEGWEFDTAILYYGEVDRVSLAEGVINASKTFDDDSIFTTKLVLDTLTGASANGAVAQPSVQTFSRPSGKSNYSVAANETPLDDTFKDTRIQVSSSWMQPFGNNWRGTVSGNFSNEYDYQSIGVSGLLERDFYQRNTTLSAGLSYQYDTIDPVGGKPTAFASMSLDGVDDSKNGSDNKSTLDMIFGVTQVINRRMLMQFNYSLSLVDGYTTDPYKYLSVVNDNGYSQDIISEGRPDSRTKHSFYVQTKYALDKGVFDISYRYATDDWDINSHTLDSRFRFDLGNNNYIQPHLRYYQQTAADFYQPFLLEDAALPQFASADYRVGEMSAYTVGLKYGQKLANNHEWGVRLEYYQQTPKNSGVSEPGVLQEIDLYPSIKALILQLNYSF
jgi:hypothetical protein